MGGTLPARQREDFVCSSRKEVGGQERAEALGSWSDPSPCLHPPSTKILSQVYQIHGVHEITKENREGAESCLQGAVGQNYGSISGTGRWGQRTPKDRKLRDPPGKSIGTSKAMNLRTRFLRGRRHQQTTRLTLVKTLYLNIITVKTLYLNIIIPYVVLFWVFPSWSTVSLRLYCLQEAFSDFSNVG